MPIIPKPLNTGIYTIRNKVNGKRYLGSTADGFNFRWRTHRNALRRGVHVNAHLQASWNKHGEHNFEFLIEERVKPEDCQLREQWWLDRMGIPNHSCWYNVKPDARTNQGVKWSKEVRKNMSEGAKRRIERPGERERLAEAGRKATSIAIERANEKRKRIKEYKDKVKYYKRLKRKKTDEERMARIVPKSEGVSEVTREKMKESGKAAWDDPIKRQKRIDGHKGVVKNEVVWNDPILKQQRLEKQWATKKVLRKLRVSIILELLVLLCIYH